MSCLHHKTKSSYILEEDGDAYIQLQMSFGTDGVNNFCKVYKPDKNGMQARSQEFLRAGEVSEN